MVEYQNIDFGGMWRFQYDALGRRVSRSSPTGFTAYVNGGQASWQVLAEFDGVGSGANLLATYVYGNYIDEPIQMSRDFDGDGAGSVQNFFYHQHDLFNVVALTAGVGGSIVPGTTGSPFPAGAVVERVRYGDYGSPEFINAAGTALAFESIARNPYLFTGREWDDGIRFYYYRTRYMEPTWGRFTTRDTIGVWGDKLGVGSANAYAASSPSKYADGSGWEAQTPSKPAEDKLDPRDDPEQGCGVTKRGEGIHRFIHIDDPVPDANRDPEGDGEGFGFWPSKPMDSGRWERRKGPGRQYQPGGGGYKYPDGNDHDNPGPCPKSNGCTQVDQDDPQTPTAPVRERLKRTNYINPLEYGKGRNKESRSATCDEIRDCIRKFIVNYTYAIFDGRHCQTFADDVIAACGLRIAE